MKHDSYYAYFLSFFSYQNISAQETGKIEGHVLDMKNEPMSK
jgi:hypothetical protein